MRDIESKKDIELIVDDFYHKLLQDDETKHVFYGLDLIHHLPKIVNFWAFVLIDEPGYNTNVFDRHVHLPLTKKHFNVWLMHFKNTIDSHFAGEKCKMAKERADVIAYTFMSKLNLN